MWFEVFNLCAFVGEEGEEGEDLFALEEDACEGFQACMDDGVYLHEGMHGLLAIGTRGGKR